MKLTRSALLFSVGLVGITAETIWSLRYKQAPDPVLTAGFLAMMGTPVFLSRDLKGSNGGSGDKDSGAADDTSLARRKRPGPTAKPKS